MTLGFLSISFLFFILEGRAYLLNDQFDFFKKIAKRRGGRKEEREKKGEEKRRRKKGKNTFHLKSFTYTITKNIMAIHL